MSSVGGSTNKPILPTTSRNGANDAKPQGEKGAITQQTINQKNADTAAQGVAQAGQQTANVKHTDTILMGDLAKMAVMAGATLSSDVQPQGTTVNSNASQAQSNETGARVATQMNEMNEKAVSNEKPLTVVIEIPSEVQPQRKPEGEHRASSARSGTGTTAADAQPSAAEQAAKGNTKTVTTSFKFDLELPTTTTKSASAIVKSNASNALLSVNILQAVLYTLMKDMVDELLKSALNDASNAAIMQTASMEILGQSLQEAAKYIEQSLNQSFAAAAKERTAADNAYKQEMWSAGGQVASGALGLAGAIAGAAKKNPFYSSIGSAMGGIGQAGIGMHAAGFGYESKTAQAAAGVDHALSQMLSATGQNVTEGMKAISQSASQTAQQLEQAMNTALQNLQAFFQAYFQALQAAMTQAH
jgi:hypothetical protein